MSIKKVSFASETTIIILDDSDDRKGPWETLALDRFRFHRRIAQIENEIQWCLEPSHRERVLKNLVKVPQLL